MSFTIFEFEQQVNATETNDNFLHIYDGNFLPRGNNSLTATDIAFDLGSGDYRWRELFVNSISADQVNFWRLLTTTTLASATSTITISGLEGDTYEVINIKMNWTKATGGASDQASYTMTFNNDSTTNFTTQYINNQAGAPRTVGGFWTNGGYTLTAGRTTTVNINLGTEYLTNVRPRSNLNFVINTKTGNTRAIEGNFYHYGNLYTVNQEQHRELVSSWNDTTTTITSINFIGDTTTAFLADTRIQVWGRK